jgi:uncharacterized protein
LVLRYKIKDIPDEGLTVDQPLSRALLGDALEGLQADLDQCSGSVRLVLTLAGQDVVVDGSVKAMVTLPCALCIAPASLLLNQPIKMVFTPSEEADDPADHSLDDIDLAHYDGEVVDLGPLVREQLILSLPISPRCKESCKGLCPVCGEDRNQRDCGHVAEEKTNPFAAALKSLKTSIKVD